MRSHEEHKSHVRSVRCAVLTFSDSRTEESDDSGKLIKELLVKSGHEIVAYQVMKDDLKAIQKAVQDLIDSDVQVIITNGGTGISKKDVTIEAISELLDKKLDGFGDIFRFLSYEHMGSAAMMSRAIAGTIKNKIVICMPGSVDAVELGMKKLILPELGHMVWETNK
ncbi:MAG: molybdenum cofactor biosynthesis protein MoaB [Methanocellales archaeon]|nr:molybdenum cofactor biosynthesis protein MoaB [Methanocellales archaeon]MDD3291693.1 molybdenum cofactor biosynthesis protein MoaB [Methanocellales archaeon]MDD5235043.1 molybdenum cofactor biosynthesis protein MoaB [Methanocellales archaeon]MDD5485181.1 molybdenum cofactor biosynthesis protein MoaB [Methanocellales archaeon]